MQYQHYHIYTKQGGRFPRFWRCHDSLAAAEEESNRLTRIFRAEGADTVASIRPFATRQELCHRVESKIPR